MKVITAGKPYLDIDAYAGCAAYAELLKLQGEPALFASTAKLNESIPPSLRALPIKLERNYLPQASDNI